MARSTNSSIVARLQAKETELLNRAETNNVTADSMEAQIEALREDAVVASSQAQVVAGVLVQLDKAGIVI